MTQIADLQPFIDATTRALAATAQTLAGHEVRLAALEAAPAPTPPPRSGPYTGTPISIPGTFEAENFDLGGEGIAYHENVKGNAGGQYRPAEDVDIIAGDGGYVVNNFETGEWLTYTVNVAKVGVYDVELRAATDSTFPNAAYHAEIDGVNVTGSVVLPNTGGFGVYQWIGRKSISLSAGKHVLKIVADQQYFNLNSIRVVAPTPLVLPPPNATRTFFSTFDTLLEGGFVEQAAVPGRASLVPFGRDGGTALRLHTEPGDGTLISGTPGAERNDLYLDQATTDGYAGREHWWEHSIWFPDDFVIPPPGHWAVVFDFHNASLIEGALANFHIDAWSGGLQFRGFGGVLRLASDAPGEWIVPIGPIVKNTWYDFVYHVKWSSGADGFFNAWVNGRQVVARTGPTLYLSVDGITTIGCYLKLANYHSGFGQPTSVIHDRVIRYNVP